MSDDRALPARVVQLEAQVANLEAKLDTLAEVYLDAGALIAQLSVEVQEMKKCIRLIVIANSGLSIIDRLAGSE